MSADVHRPERRLGTTVPFDLLAVLAATVLADVAVIATDVTPLRFLAAVGLLLFLPGYAIVASLYPRRGVGGRSVMGTEYAETDAHDGGGIDSTDVGGIDGLERVVLAFGVSLAIVPMVGLAIWAVGLTISATTVALSLSALILIASVLGFVRRLTHPAGSRVALPVGRWVGDVRRTLGGEATITDRVLAISLAISVLIAGGALVYALASPPAAGGFTAAALLAPGADGPQASSYPSEFTIGESQPLVLELQNRQRTGTTFAVVVRAERVDVSGEEPVVTEASVLDRLSLTVPAGETVQHRHQVAPDLAGDRIRLTYYVYHGEAPASPSADSADRVLYIWVSVGEA